MFNFHLQVYICKDNLLAAVEMFLKSAVFVNQISLILFLTVCMNPASFIVGFNGVSDSDTYSEALRAINQMLLELQHLGRVWTVLPSNVYYKSMGMCVANFYINNFGRGCCHG